MGYRTYIGSMPKREYNKIKSLTKIELFDFYRESKKLTGEDDYIGPYDYGKELYEFGKYTDFEPPKKSMKKFFKNKELMEKYDEHDFYVVTKEFLAYIIETYTRKIQKHYSKMLNPFSKDGKASEFLNTVKTDYGVPDNRYKFDFSKITDEQQTALFEIIEHMKGFNMEWNSMLPYDLEKGESVSTSWKYEYGVFELVRIYKSFDWKRNVMVYYGY